MLNEVMEAIAEKLEALYGEGCGVFVEETPQVPVLPYFLVESLGITLKQAQGGYKQLGRPFDILYYPASEEAPKKEINDVYERLLGEMGRIEAKDGGMLRGTGIHCETEDNVGHFLVEYNAVIRESARLPDLMGDLVQATATK